jgi:Fur family peroxide stress response transcriptional regulator
MRQTHQRLQILEDLKGRKDHPSARTIYETMRKKMPTLSRTTVYNTLSTLGKAGAVSCVNMPGQETRYECSDSQHCHFLCNSCGRLTDLEFSCGHIPQLKMDGYVVQEVVGCFKGICRHCAEEGGAPSG